MLSVCCFHVVWQVQQCRRKTACCLSTRELLCLRRRANSCVVQMFRRKPHLWRLMTSWLVAKIMNCLSDSQPESRIKPLKITFLNGSHRSKVKKQDKWNPACLSSICHSFRMNHRVGPEVLANYSNNPLLFVEASGTQDNGWS